MCPLPSWDSVWCPRVWLIWPFHAELSLRHMTSCPAVLPAGACHHRQDACRYGHDSAVAIHPGIVHTHLATGFFQQTGSSALPFMKQLVAPLLNCLYPLLLRTPDNSADSMLLAATAPASKVAGRYLHNDRLARPDKVSDAELWACLLLAPLLMSLRSWLCGCGPTRSTPTHCFHWQHHPGGTSFADRLHVWSMCVERTMP